MRLNANAPQAVRAPVGGRRSRDKGARIVRFLQERGFAAERVPLSGAAGGRFADFVTAYTTEKTPDAKKRAPELAGRLVAHVTAAESAT
jgi:hypothetical protein